jgi:hypothetical protein
MNSWEEFDAFVNSKSAEEAARHPKDLVPILKALIDQTVRCDILETVATRLYIRVEVHAGHIADASDQFWAYNISDHCFYTGSETMPMIVWRKTDPQLFVEWVPGQP